MNGHIYSRLWWVSVCVLMRVTVFTLFANLLDVEFSSAALKAGARRTFPVMLLSKFVFLGVFPLYLHFIHSTMFCVPFPFSPYVFLCLFTVCTCGCTHMHTHTHAHTHYCLLVSKCFLPLVKLGPSWVIFIPNIFLFLVFSSFSRVFLCSCSNWELSFLIL